MFGLFNSNRSNKLPTQAALSKMDASQIVAAIEPFVDVAAEMMGSGNFRKAYGMGPDEWKQLPKEEILGFADAFRSKKVFNNPDPNLARTGRVPQP